MARERSTTRASAGPGKAGAAAGAMLAAAALIAVTLLIAKALGGGGTGPPLHPLQVSAGRFGFALVVLALVSAAHPPDFRGVPWRLHVLRSLCGWTGVSLLFAAAALMPLAEATAISFLSPLFTMLLAVLLLGERVGAARWAAATVAMAGALVLIRPGSAAFQPAALIALAAALLTGLEAIFIKRLATGEPPLRILLVNNTIGAAVAGLAASFVWVAPSPTQWLLLAALGVTMVSAQTFFIGAMKRADASFVIPFFYATILFAALYDLMIFDEWPSAVAIAGSLLVLLGAALLAASERR